VRLAFITRQPHKRGKAVAVLPSKRFVKFSNFKPGSEYDMSQVPNAESSLLRKLKLYNWELDPFSLFQASLQLSIARAFF
jgi:hypothetical protein